MALTREPSLRRASTIGEDSSMRRPTADTMRSMMLIRCASLLKLDVGQLELAAPLDVHLLRAVDENVGHGLVGQQRLERTQAEHFVLDAADDASGATPG